MKALVVVSPGSASTTLLITVFWSLLQYRPVLVVIKTAGLECDDTGKCYRVAVPIHSKQLAWQTAPQVSSVEFFKSNSLPQPGKTPGTTRVADVLVLPVCLEAFLGQPVCCLQSPPTTVALARCKSFDSTFCTTPDPISAGTITDQSGCKHALTGLVWASLRPCWVP